MATESVRGLIIAVGYTKGGATKSTTTTNLATELARQGADVLIVDADPKQPTCARWHERRTEARETNPEIKAVHCIQQSGNIKATILDSASRYDVVIIDAAGRDSRELRVALMTADIVLIPTQATQQDLESMSDMAGVLEETQDINPDRKILAFLSALSTHPGSKDATDARAIFDSFPEIQLLKAKIHRRVHYNNAFTEGLGVVEWTDSRSKAEVQVLTKEVMQYV